MKKVNLADIEYEVLENDELSKAFKEISDNVLALQNEYGIIKFNPMASGILNKRQAASAYVMIYSALNLSETCIPCVESRIFTMACMLHFAKDSNDELTADFKKNNDDIYIRDASAGYVGKNPRHKEWVTNALSKIKNDQKLFACALYADIHGIDRGEVLRSISSQPGGIRVSVNSNGIENVLQENTQTVKNKSSILKTNDTPNAENQKEQNSNIKIDKEFLNTLDNHIDAAICRTLEKYATNQNFFWHNTDKKYSGHHNTFPCEGDFRAYLFLELCSSPVGEYRLNEIPNNCMKPWIHAEANINLGLEGMTSKYADIIISDPFEKAYTDNNNILRIIETKMNFHQFTKKNGDAIEDDLARILSAEDQFIKNYPQMPIQSYLVVIQGHPSSGVKWREQTFARIDGRTKGLKIYYVDEILWKVTKGSCRYMNMNASLPVCDECFSKIGD